MRIVQTVFGVFHHFELARELRKRGHLQQVYSTWPWRRLSREGLPHSLVSSFPWVHTPEMLLHRMGYEPPWLLDQLSYLNALSFDGYVGRQLRGEPTPDVLVALSGSSLKAGREVQQRGGRFVCDRGSSHQRFQDEIVREEYARWSVDQRAADIRDVIREEAIYEQADMITVPSTFAARSFVSCGISREKMQVIPYGVRLENFRRTGEPPADEFCVLFAGSVGLRKGVPYLLQAFAALRHPRKRLRIAGSVQTDLRSLLPSLPQEHVEFLGTVPREQLASLMSTSHVMVLPSIEEGLALVQGQAMACGCPVIASTNTGAEDLFRDGVEGFIVPIRDPEALRERMERLAGDAALQQRMSAAALARVRSLGGWQDYGDQWERLLLQLVAAPPPTKWTISRRSPGQSGVADQA